MRLTLVPAAVIVWAVTRVTGRTARVITILLLAGIVYSAGLVLFHTHVGSNYRPDCPACHQERSIGSSSAAVTITPAVQAPRVIGVLPADPVVGAPLEIVVHRSSPRSPPFSV
jgi:hypothetical protein